METATQPIVDSKPTATPTDSTAFLLQNLPREKGQIVKVTRVKDNFYRCNWFQPMTIGGNEKGDLALKQGKIVDSYMVRCVDGQYEKLAKQ